MSRALPGLSAEQLSALGQVPRSRQGSVAARSGLFLGLEDAWAEAAVMSSSLPRGERYRGFQAVKLSL